MARGWDVPKRYINLSLYDGRSGGLESTKVLAQAGIEAKISFSCQSTVYGMTPQANVNIVGLTRDAMGFLASSYTFWTQNVIHNRIVIDAGYEGQHGIVYDGTIIEGIPNLESADFNISLKCMSYQNAFNENISSISKKDTDAKDIAGDIASELGVQLVSTPNGEYKLDEYNFQDTDPINQMRYLSKVTGLDIYVENDRMYMKEKGKKANGLSMFSITPDMIISAPLPTNRGCRVQIRMNPNVVCGMPVSLQSQRFPMLNGEDYFIASYLHAGETKGKKWITELELTRSNIYEG